MDPRYPTGDWYCETENCPIRTVEIFAKYIGVKPPKEPPPMKCPACGEVMLFLTYVERR